MHFSLESLREAAQIVYRQVPATPQYDWPLLSRRAGLTVWVKHENHTQAGAFKVRGGVLYMHRLKQRHPDCPGVIAATRGNHGQSIAVSATHQGLRSVICVREMWIARVKFSKCSSTYRVRYTRPPWEFSCHSGIRLCHDVRSLSLRSFRVRRQSVRRAFGIYSSRRHAGLCCRDDPPGGGRHGIRHAAQEKRPILLPKLARCGRQGVAAVLVLEPIFEADLQPEQYAYRANRRAQDAVRHVHWLVTHGHDEVVDADLSGYLEVSSYCPPVHEESANRLG